MAADPRSGRLSETETGSLQGGPVEVPVEFTLPLETLGRYRILQRIGEGGFGTVYEAEQTEPVVRRVALKVIKAGMDTRRVIARFEAERQALAMMDHANIARVLDAGATAEGRPYFVMELVKGIPISEYCDSNNLSLRERLDLFMVVCHAVQHAHQKGIIHRDLKPSNVLVAVHDGRPAPKVIDFGIAKATSHRLTEKTLYTEMQHFIGTPHYMSPEQAEQSGLDVDTRSDIYSLGVLLYELLTGATPFDVTRLKTVSYAEVQRIIREEEPLRPSTRLARLRPQTPAAGDAGRTPSIEQIARRRRMDPTSLQKAIRGDLDWIVMRAMEKDRTRRYDTARELAEDVGRHLTHEPVKAGPPGAGYRFGKFTRRHRAALAAGSVVAAALLLGLAAAVTGFVKASRERDAKEAALETALAAQLDAERARDESEAVTQFFTEMLGSVDPRQQGRDALVYDVLNRASHRIAMRFGDSPMIEARLRHSMGEAYRVLGEYDDAEQQLLPALEIRRRVLGHEHADTMRSEMDLATLHYNAGRIDEAAALFADLLERQRAILGDEHPQTIETMTSLGVVYTRQRRPSDAEPLLREAFEAGERVLDEEDPVFLSVLNNLAGLLYTQGSYADAEPLFARVLETRRRVLGYDDPDTLTSMENLAKILRRQQRFDESEALFGEAVELARQSVGSDHPITIRCLNNMAALLRAQDRCEEAVLLSAEAAERARRIMPDHVGTAATLVGYGKCLTSLGRFEEARRALLDARRVYELAGRPAAPAERALAELSDARAATGR